MLILLQVTSVCICKFAVPGGVERLLLFIAFIRIRKLIYFKIWWRIEEERLDMGDFRILEQTVIFLYNVYP